MTKLVSLTDEAYAVLSRMKHSGESFSKLVMRVFGRKRKDIMDFAGVWEGRKDLEEAFKEVAEERKKFKFRDVRF